MSFTNPRTFPVQTTGTVAQPLLGTKLTNAIVACTTTTSDGSGHAGQSVAVTSSAVFQVGDYVNIVPASGSPNAQENQIPITAIPDSTHIVIWNGSPHAAGDFVQLYYQCQSVRISEVKGNYVSDSLYIGADNTLTSAGVNAIEDLSVVVFFETPPSPVNNHSPSDFWIVASVNAADQYRVSIWSF